ncbi:MAG: hypothetical protein QNJ18_05295 [Xenococcaceae cyanobacterium MO_167.B52]|nr:hypothetical protein [Xenococcaceae cyanobacterium MO_167.B52]
MVRYISCFAPYKIAITGRSPWHFESAIAIFHFSHLPNEIATTNDRIYP